MLKCNQSYITTAPDTEGKSEVEISMFPYMFLMLWSENAADLLVLAGPAFSNFCIFKGERIPPLCCLKHCQVQKAEHAVFQKLNSYSK